MHDDVGGRVQLVQDPDHDGPDRNGAVMGQLLAELRVAVVEVLGLGGSFGRVGWAT
jgi:hypothetical protein